MLEISRLSKERWITPEKYKEIKAEATSRSLKNQRRHRGKGKYHINPSTGKRWKKGEQNEEGWYFYDHKGYIYKGIQSI